VRENNLLCVTSGQLN